MVVCLTRDCDGAWRGPPGVLESWPVISLDSVGPMAAEPGVGMVPPLVVSVWVGVYFTVADSS